GGRGVEGVGRRKKPASPPHKPYKSHFLVMKLIPLRFNRLYRQKQFALALGLCYLSTVRLEKVILKQA
ncbi:MAG: hypothetical protein FWH20_11495, partial [Oscillospiraceae bacterium]|nr:hypothetical protein [Oscillospiraceae bacterium]